MILVCDVDNVNVFCFFDKKTKIYGKKNLKNVSFIDCVSEVKYQNLTGCCGQLSLDWVLKDKTVDRGCVYLILGDSV